MEDDYSPESSSSLCVMLRQRRIFSELAPPVCDRRAGDLASGKLHAAAGGHGTLFWPNLTKRRADRWEMLFREFAREEVTRLLANRTCQAERALSDRT
jgi:hypothetical protein